MGKVEIPYLKKRVRAGKRSVAHWYWEPSPQLRSRGWRTIALGKSEDAAVRKAMHQNAIVEANPMGLAAMTGAGGAARDGEPPAMPGSIRDMAERFLKSDWMPPSKVTQSDYKKDLRRLCSVKDMDGEPIGNWPAKLFKPKSADVAYAVLKVSGTTMAGRIARTARRCWKWGIRQEFTAINPWAQMNISAAGEREQVWTRDQVAAFLWECRRRGRSSIALATRIAYYGAQRPTDCRNVALSAYKKTAIDGECLLEIPQSKTRSSTKVRAIVPVEEYPELRGALDRSIRSLVESLGGARPHPSTPIVRREETGLAWSESEFQREAREIMKAAGIPDDLQFRDLRATATTEISDADADSVAASTHTGHATWVMRRRYTRKRLKQAQNVAQARKAARRRSVE